MPDKKLKDSQAERLANLPEREKEMLKVLNGIYALRDPEDRDVSYVFQTLPDRRLTAYYKIIQRPMSLYMIKQNIINQKYPSFAGFIRDVAQITHNARVFNRKDSIIYQDAVTVDNYLRQELERLRSEGNYEASDLEYPDLGPLPDNDAPLSDEEDDDDDDEEEEEEESGRRRGLRRRTRIRLVNSGGQGGSGSAGGDDDDDGQEDTHARRIANAMDDGRKKRGRPPTVDKPHEHRIKAIMRGVRKEKDNRGRLLYLAFEKLPDYKTYPDYYAQIREPIALDTIRKNIKRRKYASVDDFLVEMNLMFNNAKQYNADGSQIYNDAETLQRIMVALADEEMKKPDSVYQDPDSNSKTSRMPLDQVEHRGEVYRVGDWVHIANLNDPAKPTIGQIFRIWRAADGQKWVNACWYYRPEQTVHRYDKLFYENEVVKSGQYRDHLVDEILEKCFVMFFTKYQRGRPSGIGDRAVYCCESRYNETEKTFNKIRTWKACIPDEVRSTDYPMDYFDRPMALRRVVSPIKHLLPGNAREDDPIPEPKMGVANAPPIMGAVYKRPIDPNDPPEQPTPDDAPMQQPNLISGGTPRGQMAGVQTPVSGRGMVANGAMGRQSLGGNSPSAYQSPGAGRAVGSPYNVSRMAGASSYPVPGATGYVGPIPPSTFTLPENTQNLLPGEELGSVARATSGQMAWFTMPPLNVANRLQAAEPMRRALEFEVEGGDKKRSKHSVGHSAKYLAWKAAKAKA